jgi:presenilin-like A22 family membrane protease
MLQSLCALLWLVGLFLIAGQAPALRLLVARTQAETIELSLAQWLLAFAVAFAALYFLYTSRLFGHLIAASLGFIMLPMLSLLVGDLIALLGAFALILFERTRRSYLSNNLLLSLAVIFGAIPIAASYSLELILLLLFVFSIYDVLGVFATRVIPALARGAIAFNLPLLLLVPRATVPWQAKPTSENAAAVIGGGDLFLPMLMIGAVTFGSGIPLGLATLAGAMFGWVMNLGLAAVVRTGIPALPMLTVGMMVAYFSFR